MTIDRHRLMAALDRAADQRVTVVSAPAGSGKTSLLHAWADRASRAQRVAYLAVRPEQHDAQLFWLALLAAVRSATGGDQPAPAPAFSGPAMLDRVRAELASPGGRLVLIIDDLHELSSAEARDQLATLLADLPPGVRAVLAGRGDPPLRLHRLRLAGELTEIRAGQLRFTVDETRQLLAASGITLAAPVVTALHQRTEGWAAGLRLAALSLAGHPDPERFVAEFSGSDRAVAEYLMAEMLDRQPPDVRRLLLRTSLVDRVNGELADLLAGTAGSERVLLGLEDAGAFVVSLDHHRTWFRYHHLFAGLLRLELRRTDPEDIPELHRLAAGWFAGHGHAADAIGHQQAAGDWPAAARLLTDHALSLTLDGQAGTVAQLLRRFPVRVGDDSPGLALVHAIADLDRLRLDDARAHLAVVRAYAATTPPERQHRLRTVLTCMDLLLARLRGHFDAVFEQAGALAPGPAGQSHTDVALDSDLRAVALLNLGVTEAWSLRLARSEAYLREGAALARDIGRPYLEVACLAHLGFAATRHSLAQARRRGEDAIALAARHGWDNEPVIAPALATLAGVLVLTGEFEEGEKWLGRARQVTRAGGEPGLQMLIHLIAALAPAARGRPGDALAELVAAGQAHAAMAGSHGLGARVTAWAIATRARLGEVEPARAALAAVDERLAATAEIRNAAAVIRLAERDPIGARRELRTVLDGGIAAARALTMIEAHLLDALAARELGDERAARIAVERALHLAEPDRLILPFAMTGAWTLLATLPGPETSHAGLIADILDAVHGPGVRAGTAEPVDKLSPSELRVLRYLPTNLTRPEIAGKLSVSPNTVNTHIRRIYAKLGATDRSSAVQRGRELRLLSASRA